MLEVTTKKQKVKNSRVVGPRMSASQAIWELNIARQRVRILLLDLGLPTVAPREHGRCPCGVRADSSHVKFGSSGCRHNRLPITTTCSFCGAVKSVLKSKISHDRHRLYSSMYCNPVWRYQGRTSRSTRKLRNVED